MNVFPEKMGKTTCAPYVAMVVDLVVQTLYGASTILIKVALEKGLNQFVLFVYQHLIAMFILGPLAYAFERYRLIPQFHPLSMLMLLLLVFLYQGHGLYRYADNFHQYIFSMQETTSFTLI